MEIVKAEKPDMSRCCATCPYWSPVVNPRVPEKIGECRYDIPKVMLVPVVTLQGQGASVQAHFPLIVESGWCGQHPARDKALSFMPL